MKKNKHNMTTHALLSTALLVTATSTQAAILTTSGDINIAANWDTAALPLTGETGTVDIDSSWPDTSNAGLLLITGDLVFGGGSTLTATIDVVGNNPNSVTFNDVTVNVDDDIFTGGPTGNFIFNDGSVTNVDDDFEANGGGTITVNGGTHNVGIAVTGGNFGAQRGSTLNFLGGTVVADGFRTTAGNAGTPLGGTINIGGDATLTATSVTFDSSGVVDFATNWTGSLTIPGVDWEATLISSATLDGSAIDAAIFSANFVVSGDSLAQITVGTPPILTSISPDNGDIDVPATSILVASFDEPITLGATGDITIRNLTNPPADIVISLPGPDADGTLSTSSNTLTIDPTTDLVAGDQYAIQIGATVVEDLEGNPYVGISDTTTWSFTTDGTPPILVATTPTDDEVDVIPTTNLEATFDENIALGATGTITIRNLTNPADIEITLPGPDPDGTLTIAGAVLTIDPTVDLVAGDEYAIEFSSTAIENLSGLSYPGILATDDPNWSFTTDGTPPSAIDMGPMTGATDIPLDENLTLTFGEDVQAGTGFITIHLTSDDSIVEVIDVTSSNVIINGSEITINPTDEFSNSTDYYVTITAGAFTDLSGNPYAGISDSNVFTFRTADVDPTVLFADTFNRPDTSVTSGGSSTDGDINGTNAGKTGTLGSLMWTGRAFANNTFGVIDGALTQVDGLDGINGGLAYINDHNFTDTIISAGGGFSVTVDIVSYATGGSGRYWAIGVGQSLAELDGLTENNNSDAVGIPSADLLVAYRATTNDLEIFNNGVLNTVETITNGLPAAPTTMRIEYSLPNFNAGSIVNYSVFFDDSTAAFASGSFTWSGTDENYISVGNNLTNTSRLDNFVVKSNVAFLDPLQLDIVQNGGNLDFEWNSMSGNQYDLVSNTDLMTAPSTWSPYNDGIITYEDILSTGTGTQTLSGVLKVDDRRFFALIEEPIPPILSEDFENGDGGFTFVKTEGSDWVHGDPDSTGPGGTISTGNGGSINCWGTDISNPGFYLNPTTDTCLRSSVIDLTDVAAAQLTFAQAIDLEENDSVTVNIIDDVTDTVIAANIVSVSDSDIESSPWESVGPVTIPSAALGQSVRIEWCLSGTGGPNNDYLGWYIDDVVVTPITP